MHISYQKIIHWFRVNLKILIIIETACFVIATIYLVFAPRIFEATFSLRLPKVLSVPSSTTEVPQLRLLISPQEFIRPTQNPMTYPAELISDCMGEDTNANRKKLIGAMQIGVLQQGDVVSFSLRLGDKARVAKCANLILIKSFNDLVLTQENYLSSLAKNILNGDQPPKEKQFINLEFKKPEVIQAVRMSDSYVKPEFPKTFIGALLIGIFLTIFISIMRNRYRA